MLGAGSAPSSVLPPRTRATVRGEIPVACSSVLIPTSSAKLRGVSPGAIIIGVPGNLSHILLPSDPGRSANSLVAYRRVLLQTPDSRRVVQP